VPVFLVGQIGDQSISLHGENGQLVINTPDGVTKTVDYEKFGHLKERLNGNYKEAERAQEGQHYKNTTNGDTGEGALDIGDEGATRKSASAGNVFDGILAGSENQERNFDCDRSSAGENLAVVSTGDFRDASGVTETAQAAEVGFDFGRRSENTEEEDSRIRERSNREVNGYR
jgi:hypothetical protein